MREKVSDVSWRTTLGLDACCYVSWCFRLGVQKGWNEAEEFQDEDRKGNVFRVAKQLVSFNRDVMVAGCVRDNSGKIVTRRWIGWMEVWKVSLG